MKITRPLNDRHAVPKWSPIKMCTKDCHLLKVRGVSGAKNERWVRASSQSCQKKFTKKCTEKFYKNVSQKYLTKKNFSQKFYKNYKKITKKNGKKNFVDSDFGGVHERKRNTSAQRRNFRAVPPAQAFSYWKYYSILHRILL